MTEETRQKADAAIAMLQSLADPARVSLLLGGATFPAALWSGADLRFRWMNRAFRMLLGPSTVEWDLLGMPMRGFLSDTPSATRFVDVAYTGQPYTDPEYEFRLPDGRMTFWQLSYVPVSGRVGDPNDVLLIAIDQTEPVAQRRRIASERDDLRAAMNLIETTILSSLDAEEILQRVLVESTEAFGADWSWIAMRDGGKWVFRNQHGWVPEMVGFEFTETERSLPRLAAEAHTTVFEADPQTASPAHRDLMEEYDIGAFMLVPLLARGDVSGVMGFCWDSEMWFAEAHMELAWKLEVSLSLALENARLYRVEHEVTRTLQSAFFTAPRLIDGIEFGHLYHSASTGTRVGGDFYDLIDLENARVGMIMGDVSGHGLDVAALTHVVKSSMRAEALRTPSPGAIVRRANDVILKSATSETYASAFFGMLETDTGHLSYCIAGHPAPVLVRRGGVPILLPEPQMIVGAVSDVQYTNSETVLDVGDLLVLYTDGLTEARNTRGERYGTERLLDAVGRSQDSSASELPEALFMDAFSFAQGGLEDDVAILAMRRTGVPSGHEQSRLELESA